MSKVELKNKEEMIDWLGQEIDKYENRTLAEKNSGPLMNLSSKLILKDRIVTPTYTITKEALKTFLFLKVMKVYHPDNKSKVSWTNIQTLIKENKGKKYCLNLDALNKYFDIEANKQAFLEESAFLDLHQFEEENLKEVLESIEVVEEGLSSGMWLPYLLLRDIQATARECLGAYHKYYMEHKDVYENYEIKEEEDDYDISDNICNESFYKGNEYNIHDKMNTIIFDQYDRLDICDKYNENLIKKEKRNKNKDEYYKKLQDLHKDCMLAILLHEIFWRATSVSEQAADDISFMAPLIAFYQEFWVGLVTEQFFMIVFESVFLDDLHCTKELEKANTMKDIKWLAERNMDIKELQPFAEVFTDSYNKIEAYKKSQKYLQEFFKELNDVKIFEKKLDIELLFLCMRDFLEKVQDKNLSKDKEKLYHLWKLQSVISSWALVQEKEAEKPDWFLKLEEEVEKFSKNKK